MRQIGLTHAPLSLRQFLTVPLLPYTHTRSHQHTPHGYLGPGRQSGKWVESGKIQHGGPQVRMDPRWVALRRTAYLVRALASGACGY